MPVAPRQTWGDKSVSSRGLTIVAVLVSLACCWCGGPLAMSLGPSEALAKQFVVPVYPGSTQVSHWRSGASDNFWEETSWHTSDSVETVVADMESKMPGFV